MLIDRPFNSHGGISNDPEILIDQRGVILYPVTVNGLRSNSVIGDSRPL
jgi:hypothetical protein